MKLNHFSPRSRSVVVYVLAMICYCYTLKIFFDIIAIISLPAASEEVSRTWVNENPCVESAIEFFLIYPFMESLILMFAIEFFGLIRLYDVFRVILSTAVMFAAQWHDLGIDGIVTIPLFLISACAYIQWRRVSWKVGYLVLVSINAALNVIPYIDLLIDKHHSRGGF